MTKLKNVQFRTSYKIGPIDAQESFSWGEQGRAKGHHYEVHLIEEIGCVQVRHLGSGAFKLVPMGQVTAMEREQHYANEPDKGGKR